MFSSAGIQSNTSPGLMPYWSAMALGTVDCSLGAPWPHLYSSKDSILVLRRRRLCRGLKARGRQQVPHRAFSPVRNDNINFCSVVGIAQSVGIAREAGIARQAGPGAAYDPPLTLHLGREIMTLPGIRNCA